jgi:Ca2+-binding EF-hand superfamily protein
MQLQPEMHGVRTLKLTQSKAQVLDPEQKGYLDIDAMKKLFMEKGEPLSTEEMEEMISSIGIKDNRFYYGKHFTQSLNEFGFNCCHVEDYLALLE